MKNYTKLVSFLLFAPQLIIIGILILGVGAGLIQSFGIIPALNLDTWTLDYYREALSNPNIVASLSFTLKIAFISSILALVLGLGAIYLLIILPISQRRFIRVVQIPIIIPHIVVALIIIVTFAQTGMLARVFDFLGLGGARGFFGTLLYRSNGIGIILAYIWKATPFIIFYCYEIIMAADEKYGEASRTMGASRLTSYLSVTLPICKETIFSGFLIQFMFAFGAYELPRLLGPTLPKHLAELAYIEYTHPDLLNRPLAMAMNGIILFVAFIAMCIYFVLNRKRRY